MANLDIAERRVPQDGYLRVRSHGAEAYLRVSTLPARHGEKVVLRLFEPERGLLALEELGLSDEQLGVVGTLLGHSHGMILVTGPTGCGKTTTLRACIHRLRAEHLNIISVEDPIEYEIGGITQIPINERVGLTFAEALRAILRQDPNIIMLGEIRDAETAEVAVRASLTGHLLLSTVHTNDAASAILRLVNLGVDPYLLAASTIGVVAQRLVRLVCPSCREPAIVPAALLAEFPRLGQAVDRLVRGRGCAACRYTGYLGRTGIYELLALDGDGRALLAWEAGGSRFHEAMRAGGAPTLFDDGLRKVALGLTTLDEVLRVSTAPMGGASWVPPRPG
jgi:type II secretory ATPase GspE/PulE/Tfp pilus assembly ATPase PilB-like protein